MGDLDAEQDNLQTLNRIREENPPRLQEDGQFRSLHQDGIYKRYNNRFILNKIWLNRLRLASHFNNIGMRIM